MCQPVLHGLVYSHIGNSSRHVVFAVPVITARLQMNQGGVPHGPSRWWVEDKVEEQLKKKLMSSKDFETTRTLQG